VRARAGAYRRLFSEVRRPLSASIVVALAQSALIVPVPLLIRHIFDADLRHGRGGALAAQGAIVLALYLASAGLGQIAQ